MPKRENKSRFAVLGILTTGPQSGYDIKKAFDTWLSSFWKESYGQIYGVLNGLLKDGLAIKKVIKREGKPDRHVYTITNKGLRLFRAWLVEPPPRQIGRHEMVLKLLFGDQISASECLNLVETFRTLHQEEVSELKDIRNCIQKESQNDPALPFYLMSVRYGELVNEAYIKWCNETTRMLSGMEKMNKADRKRA